MAAIIRVFGCRGKLKWRVSVNSTQWSFMNGIYWNHFEYDSEVKKLRMTIVQDPNCAKLTAFIIHSFMNHARALEACVSSFLFASL